MKGPRLAVLFLFAMATAMAQPSFEERMAIKETVAKWNSAHHISTIYQLNNLYASSVFFYGKYKPRETCIYRKSDSLNQNLGFHQEIITPIEIICYKSGTIKCSFTKRVRYQQTVTDYPGYLLLKKSGDLYQIIGESDLATDQRLAIQLGLGEEQLPESPKSNSYWVIFSVAILLFLAVVVWMMGKSEATPQSFVRPKTSATPSGSPASKKVNGKVAKEKKVKRQQLPSIEKAEATRTNDEEDKGRAFEEYIVDKFPKDRFNLVEWRSDKNSKGRFPEASRWPDLQLELKLQSEKFPFAVECKWRSDFWKGIIEWARDSQISSYQEFQVSKEMPVFVALGVGGTPSNPKDLFIIPLGHLYKPILTEEWLKKYKRESRGNFFLNLDPISLK